MNLNGRLNRLSPVLSARERAVLVLRSLKEGKVEHRSWRETMRYDQLQEFNRLVGLMNACNIQLAASVTGVAQMVDSLELKAFWAGTLALLTDSRPAKNTRSVDFLKKLEGLPDVLDGEVTTKAPWAWRRLRGMEIVLAEVSAEFGGESLLPAYAEEALQGAKERLQELRQWTTGFELPEPDDEEVEGIRQAVKRWAVVYES